MRKSIYVIIIFFQFYTVFSNTAFPGFKSWSSPYRMALGGSGYLSFSPLTNRNNPASIKLKKSFYSGLIRYPSNIIAQSLAITFPKEREILGLTIQNLSYGTFDGYTEEAIPTEKYSSSDTWVNFCISRSWISDDLRWGIIGSWFRSRLDQRQINSIIISLGLQLNINPLDLKLGASLNNYGKIFAGKSKTQGELPEEIVISLEKKLMYLPMNVFFDVLINSNKKFGNTNLGFKVKLNSHLDFMFGTSLNKIRQNTGQTLWNSFFGASGIGLSYNVNSIEILYSSFFLGTGVLYNGISFEIEFK